MAHHSPLFQNSRFSKIIFWLSVVTATFWFTSQVKGIYKTVFGSVLDLLWMPMQGLLFLLPLLSIILFIVSKFNLRSLYLYSFLIMIAVFAFLLLG